MQTKVTSYPLSKQLDALGFESESHCGWWCEYNGMYGTSDKQVYCSPKEEVDKLYGDNEVKAYDCFDLLMWLKDYSSLDRDREGKYYYDGESRYARDYASFCFDKFNQKWIYDYPRWSDDNQTVWSTEAEDPTTALALAIIEILKEREDG